MNTNSLFFFLTLALSLFSCSTQKNMTAGWDYSSAPDNEIYVLNARLEYVVNSSDSVSSQIKSLMESHQAYLLEAGMDNCLLKVPAKNFDAFIDETKFLGEMSYKNISAKNVTVQLSDLNIRLENATNARQRYLSLMESSGSLDETLKLERELERLNLTIEQLQSQLKVVETDIAYSTVNLRWKTKKKPGIIGYIGIGLYKSVKWLFVRN